MKAKERAAPWENNEKCLLRLITSYFYFPRARIYVLRRAEIGYKLPCDAINFVACWRILASRGRNYATALKWFMVKRKGFKSHFKRCFQLPLPFNRHQRTFSLIGEWGGCLCWLVIFPGPPQMNFPFQHLCINKCWFRKAIRLVEQQRKRLSAFKDLSRLESPRNGIRKRFNDSPKQFYNS